MMTVPGLTCSSPLSSGGSPRFGEVILKIASRCDLACDYCYMYELGDDSWKSQPRFIEQSVADAVAKRVAEHARDHDLEKFRLILHGGEPLLAGAERIKDIISAFQSALPTNVKLRVSAQSNGMRLTEEMLASLPPELSIGISLDGDERASSRHRLLPNGKSSHPKVAAALALLRENRERYAGILAVIDIENEPVATYHALRQHEPPSIDFLMPLMTRDSPLSGGEHGRWLARVFDAWYLDTDPRAPVIRTFRIIIERLLGRDVRSGFIGPPPDMRSLVVQSDGSAELLDALRVVGDGAAKTGLSILDSSLSEIARHPGYTQPEPCAECQSCRLFEVCGGGYYPQRFSSKNGYDNPSVYCADMVILIDHIKEKLAALASV
jgi:uncharacterized protein